MPEQLKGGAFFTACRDGQRERVEGHVDADGPVDMKSPYKGCTGLMGAARGGQTDLVGYLVSHGADVNATSKSGVTALHWGALHGKEDCVRRLLGANADASIKPHRGGWKGLTALQLAEKFHRPWMVALLRQHAAAAPAPSNVYGKSKLAMEQTAVEVFGKHRTVCFRLSNMLGEGKFFGFLI